MSGIENKNHVGVHFMKNVVFHPWKAYITINRKNIFLGTYETFEEAVKARTNAEKELNIFENRGVYYNPKNSKKNPWEARTYNKGKHIHIGLFKTKEEAKHAYNFYLTYKTHKKDIFNIISKVFYHDLSNIILSYM